MSHLLRVEQEVRRVS